MHPILRSPARLGAYLLGWAPVAVLLFTVGLSNHWSWLGCLLLGLPVCLVGAFLFLSSWYLCKAFPLGRGDLRIQAIVWLTAALVMGNLWATGAWFLAKALSRFPQLTGGTIGPWPGPLWTIFMAMGTLLYLATLALHYLLEAVERRLEAERAEQVSRTLAREAELKALRAQLNPHFLFNSLNSISALTSLDAKRAREMCVLLSDFLRKSLKLGERRSVPLSEEMDLLRSYLTIEQIRFGSRLQTELDLDPAVADVEIPPLLLQPLVENAIKHGIAQVMEGGLVRVTARAKGSSVDVCVDNPTDLDTEAPIGLGMGLKQVRQRLTGRFGADVRFEAGIVEDRHHVHMVFPRTPLQDS